MLIDKAWEDYRQLVVPHTAGETQIRETRRAFYAGALLVFEAINTIGEDHVSENTGVDILAQIARECGAFKAEMAALARES